MSEYKLLKWNSNINAFIFLSLGLLLLIFPIESISIASYLIASILMLSGAGYIIRFVKNKGIQTNGDIIYLILSVLMIGISISIFIDPTWIIRVINIVVGIILIVTASMNVKNLLSFKKDRTTSWWIYLSLIVLIIVLGIVVIINPLWLAKIITRLEGASLILDTLITILLTRKVTNVLMIKENNEIVD